ncbi:uncharacterized protein LOC135401745 [Ornithodoros turicata]|uniref:uncharacterized protein LOC135401745 n=1 Tax=Ornithodoros turicata TaxID=34597 RepID=UPI00313981B8
MPKPAVKATSASAPRGHKTTTATPVAPAVETTKASLLERVKCRFVSSRPGPNPCIVLPMAFVLITAAASASFFVIQDRLEGGHRDLLNEAPQDRSAAAKSSTGRTASVTAPSTHTSGTSSSEEMFAPLLLSNATGSPDVVPNTTVHNVLEQGADDNTTVSHLGQLNTTVSLQDSNSTGD